MSQIPFQIKHKSNYSQDDYFVTESNKVAKQWIDKWPDWGDAVLSNITIIYGEEGSGKTHLSKIWQAKSEAYEISKDSLSSKEYISENADALLLEDIDTLVGFDEHIFHLINFCINNKKFLVITLGRALPEVDFALPDLLSRLRAILQIHLEKPDQEMFEQIIFKNLSDRQIAVDPKVINYLAKRMDRSYPEISKIVKKLDELSLETQNKLTIPLIQKNFNFD